MSLKFGILSMVVLLVIYVPNIKEVFGLAGATVATMLVIIMPAGFYYKVSFFLQNLTPSLKIVKIFTLYVGFDSFSLSFYMCGGDPT